MGWYGVRPRGLQACAVVLAAAVAAACTGGGSTPASHPSSRPVSAAPRIAGWHADLHELLPSVAAVHPDLADGVRPELRAEVSALDERVDSLNNDELMAGVMRFTTHIAADGRDGHTGLFVWGNGNRPVHSLPLRWWFFTDGLYVEDALGAAVSDLVGARVVRIAGRPLAEVVRRVDPLIPRENESTLQLLRPRFLLIPEVLHGVGLLDQAGTVPLDVVMRDGQRRSVDVEPVPMADYNGWAGEYGLHHVARPGVDYLAHTGRVLWHQVLPEERALYIAFNRAQFLDPDQMAEIRRLARSPDIDRVVVDIRHNFGGDTTSGQPLIDLLADRRVSAKRLYLLTGRNTFSAGSLFAAELVDEVPAKVVGEPMSSAPTSYGNQTTVTLNYSGLVLSVAGTREVAVSEDDRRTTLRPDLPVQLSSADYFGDRDPVLAAALTDES